MEKITLKQIAEEVGFDDKELRTGLLEMTTLLNGHFERKIFDTEEIEVPNNAETWKAISKTLAYLIDYKYIREDKCSRRISDLYETYKMLKEESKGHEEEYEKQLGAIEEEISDIYSNAKLVFTEFDSRRRACADKRF